MKIEFFYSKVYFLHLNKYQPTNRSWEEVKKLGQKFEKKYKTEIEQIIKIIPKLTQKPWRRKLTEVYINSWTGPSFSHPLTLTVREDLLLMLVILTHELLHDFYLGEDKKNLKKTEEKINELVKEVFVKLKIDANKQLAELQGFHDKKFT
jgi:hypothetical protein